MVTLLEEIDPEYYGDLSTHINAEGSAYMPKKTIYVTLEASLLFWGELSKSLGEMGYQINEYDWCVMNNIIDKKIHYTLSC